MADSLATVNLNRCSWRFDLQLFAGEKTEAPTPRRREKAQQQGNIFRSPELNAAIGLLATFGILQATGSGLVNGLVVWSQKLWSQPVRDWSVGDVRVITLEASLVWAKAAGPVLAAALIMGVVMYATQGRLTFSFAGLTPSLDKLSPFKGFQRLFSLRSSVEFIKGMVKLAIVSWVGYSVLMNAAYEFDKLAFLDPLSGARLVLQWVNKLAWRMGIALVIIAVADHFYQKWEYERNLRMSHQELKEEAKEIEGDPQVRSWRRRRQREIARMSMLRDVPKAQVVIANPEHFAVALRYVPEEMEVPVVVAKGKGHLAQRIKAIARENGVVVVEEPPLARSLYKLVDVGKAIPEELYQAVAEVLAFVWKLKGRF